MKPRDVRITNRCTVTASLGHCSRVWQEALMGSQDETPSCKCKCTEARFPQDCTRSKSVRHGRVRPHENKGPLPGAMRSVIRTWCHNLTGELDVNQLQTPTLCELGQSKRTSEIDVRNTRRRTAAHGNRTKPLQRM
jgi:hypothetical protein